MGSAGLLFCCRSVDPAQRGPAVFPAEVPSNTGSILTNSDIRSDADAAVIVPGLTLNIAVLVRGRKEIDESGKRVSEKGDVALPLVGDVQVAGRSLRQATSALIALYSKFYVDPQVIVDFSLDTGPDAVSPWGYVTVLGRVKKPGRIPIPATRNLTVSGAIQRAGGFDTSARDTAIRVTRRMAGGTLEVREVNLRAVGSQGQIAEDVGLGPEDIVYVHERRF